MVQTMGKNKNFERKTKFNSDLLGAEVGLLIMKVRLKQHSKV